MIQLDTNRKMSEANQPDQIYNNKAPRVDGSSIPAPLHPTRPEWLYDEPLSSDRWQELERAGIGWKLHLNFDASNPEAAARVHTYLTGMAEAEGIATFKIGRNSGQSGKEATVYIGPRDKAQLVAEAIESSLDPILLTPEGDTLNDDIPFTTRVMGRFDAPRSDQIFHQYGAQGLPYLKEDMDPFNKKDKDAAVINASNVLIKKYGSYFSGTKSAQEVERPPVFTLETERRGVVLREIASKADDQAIHDAVRENPERLGRHGSIVAKRYSTLESTERARLNTPNTELWMGIWNSGEFEGTVDMRPGKEADEAEIGYWLKESAEGHGFATLAVRALVEHIRPRYRRIYAEVHPDNSGSARVLERAGFVRLADTVQRTWGGEEIDAIVYELPGPSQSTD